jgi:TonB-dependent starch-binding outer membrane protein SusC
MRATAFVAGAMISMLPAAPVSAQARAASHAPAADSTEAILARRANLSVTALPLVQALERLAERSGVPMAFSASRLPGGKDRVSCDCRDLTVAQALDRMLAGRDLEYAPVSGQVVVFPRAGSSGSAPGPKPVSPAARVALVSNTAPGAADTTSSPTARAAPIEGVVLNARTQQPVAGARVVVQGTSLSALTDGQGRFRIQDVAGDSVTVRVIMIGFRPLVSRVVVGASDLRLLLQESAIELDEVVVTGTPGAVEKRALGNSVAQIKAADLTDVTAANDAGQLIRGRAAGVVVQQTSGNLGSGPRIIIRGNSSLSLRADPVIYVDGVRVNNAVGTGPLSLIVAGTGRGEQINRLADFNPDEIETIEIIKGPAAATLYGTEAANGVIQIITKKGRAQGGTELTASMKQGGNWFDEDLIPTNYGLDPVTSQIMEVNYVEFEKARGTPIFRTGHSQGYALQVSGGSGGGALRYFASADLDRDKGVMEPYFANRFSSRVNLSLVPHPSLDASLSAGFLTSSTGVMPTVIDFMSSLTRANPADLHRPHRGYRIGAPELWHERALEFEQDVSRSTVGIQLQHKPTSWLTQRLTSGFDITRETNSSMRSHLNSEQAPLWVFIPAWALGRRVLAPVDARYVTFDYSLGASNPLGEAFRSTLSLGAQYSHKEERAAVLAAEEFPASGVETISGAARTSAGETFVENNTLGVYIQEQVSWRDRVFVTGALRADDNSAFGSNFDYVTYPKVSGSWIVADEAGGGLGPLSPLKLRAAYGASGQQPDVFAAIRAYGQRVGPDDRPVLTPLSVGNPDLKPERSEEVELGFDAGLFGQRLGLEFTYYRKHTEDAILPVPVDASTGFGGTTRFINAGSIKNHGIEVLARAQIVDSRSADFDLSINLATNDNTVQELGVSGVEFFSPPLRQGFVRFQPGHPAGSYFVKRISSARLDPATRQVVDILCAGADGGEVACSQAPRFFAGRSKPNFEGSVTPTLTLFDRLSISGTLVFRSGHKLWNVVTESRCATTPAVCRANFFPEEFDPKVLAAYQLNRTEFNTYENGLLQDASFAKIQEVAVDYTLPNGILALFGAERGYFTVAARNLHTWTDYDGDPEVSDYEFYTSQHPMPSPTTLLTTVRLVF